MSMLSHNTRTPGAYAGFYERGAEIVKQGHTHNFYFDCGLQTLLMYISAYDWDQKYKHYHCTTRKSIESSVVKYVNQSQV